MHDEQPFVREIEQALAAQRETSARTDEVLARLVERLDALESAVSDASLVSLLRRRYRRAKTRLQDLARRR